MKAKQMTKNDTVSIREVYTLVDKAKEDILVSIRSVDTKVETLQGEAGGRIAKVESKVANIEGRLLMIPLIVSTAISLFGIIISLVITKTR